MAYILTSGMRAYGYGMGDVSATQAASSGTGIASGVSQIVSSSTVGGKISGAGTMIMSAAPFAGPAAPIVAIVGAVVTVAGQIIKFVGWGDGCGQTCIATTTYANNAEALLRKNIDAYFSSAVRNTSTQVAALAGFDSIWNQLATACGAADMGDAGKACTSDRNKGACHWKQTGDSPWPGGPKIGECWNWFAAYRDPIANDTGVVPDSAIDMGTVSSSSSSTTSTDSSSTWLAVAAIAGLVALGVSL